MRDVRPYAEAICRANARRHMRTRWLLSGLGSVLGIAIVAISLSKDTHAVGPDRPFRAYAPFVASDEGSAAPVATPTAQPTSAPPSTPVPAPGAGNEINLQPQLDTAHAVSQFVTVAAGATLTTTGADGSRYTLTLPVDSVLFDVTVTMTPVKALGDLPADGGLKAGVQLEPDGMSLGVPATLDIVPASPVAVSEEISFSYSGNGHQAYAYGMDANASRTRFTILHFSGWGVGGGTDAQRTSMFQSRVDSARDRISQRVAPVVEAERQRQRYGVPSDEGSDEFQAAQALALAEGYRDVVQPAMDTAESLAESGDIDSVTPGLEAFLAWERQMQVLGSDMLQAERAALWQQAARIVDKVRRNMRDRCFNQHDLSMAVRLMAAARQFALLGNSAAAAQAVEDAKKCLTFKLDFETVLITNGGFKISEMHVRALGVPLRLGLDATFPVTQPIELLLYTGEAPGDCSYSADVHVTRPFLVNSGRLVFSIREGKWEVTDVELNIEPGDLAGSYTWHCPPGFTQVFPVPDGYLGGTFNLVHLGDIDRAVGGVRIVGWDMIRGSVYARKTYSQTAEPVTERTTFDLKHAPE